MFKSVDSLPQAEKWRSTIIGEISVKLTKIQDPALNEYQIRDINDSLNKLFNEKRSCGNIILRILEVQITCILIKISIMQGN